MVIAYVPPPIVKDWLVQHPKEAATIRSLIASVVGWIVDPAPEDGLLGPVGGLGGTAKHILSRDYEAPFPFAEAKHVEDYVNKVSISRGVLGMLPMRCSSPESCMSRRATFHKHSSRRTHGGTTHSTLKLSHSSSTMPTPRTGLTSCHYDSTTGDLGHVDFEHIGVRPRVLPRYLALYALC